MRSQGRRSQGDAQGTDRSHHQVPGGRYSEPNYGRRARVRRSDRSPSDCRCHHTAAYPASWTVSGSMPLFLIAPEARVEVRNSISRMEPSISLEPVTIATENV